VEVDVEVERTAEARAPVAFPTIAGGGVPDDRGAALLPRRAYAQRRSAFSVSLALQSAWLEMSHRDR
jgi:hypothetical protein